MNQRYFALTDAEGKPAPAFVFAANIAAPDGGAAIIAGNERVLRARLSDARHFWDLDRRETLKSRVEALRKVTFHARLGSQYDRVGRLARLADHIAKSLDGSWEHAYHAATLAKADLTTGMVGEFPELQGVMGGYYAMHDGEHPEVAAPSGIITRRRVRGDAVPTAPVTIAVALADKIDLLAQFFAIDEKPTGSGDPYALRRAALGVIRIIRENGLRLPLRPELHSALSDAQADDRRKAAVQDDVLAFIVERLRVQLRTEGRRHDVLAAAFAAANDDDLTRLLSRADAVEDLLGTAEGADLLAAYRRATNILRIEERKAPVQDLPVSDEDKEKIAHRNVEPCWGCSPSVSGRPGRRSSRQNGRTMGALRQRADVPARTRGPASTRSGPSRRTTWYGKQCLRSHSIPLAGPMLLNSCRRTWTTATIMNLGYSLLRRWTVSRSGSEHRQPALTQGLSPATQPQAASWESRTSARSFSKAFRTPISATTAWRPSQDEV